MAEILQKSISTFRFGGYASLFGITDLGGDQVMRGAFTTSLKNRSLSHIPMLYQHHQEEPVGRWISAEERPQGLYVIGELNKDVQRARELVALMQQGAVSGLSIGFKAIRALNPRTTNSHMQGKTKRQLQQIDLFEISIVPMPMLPGARINWLDNDDAKSTSLLSSSSSLQPSFPSTAKESILTLINQTKHMLQEGAK